MGSSCYDLKWNKHNRTLHAYLLNYVFKESHSREKRWKKLLKDNNKCLIQLILPGSILKSLCVLTHWLLTTSWLLFCQLGICATERWSNLPKVTQLLSAFTSVWTWVVSQLLSYVASLCCTPWNIGVDVVALGGSCVNTTSGFYLPIFL